MRPPRVLCQTAAVAVISDPPPSPFLQNRTSRREQEEGTRVVGALNWDTSGEESRTNGESCLCRCPRQEG